MKKISYTFSRQTTDYYFNANWADFNLVVHRDKSILVTDENVHRLHQKKFDGWKTIVIPAGEKHKQQSTADHIVSELIALEADKTNMLIGVGGGVVTDITGYVASTYLRGVEFGFVPTTLLAMVDAANGGKNGIDIGQYKNLVGTISQPHFIYFDLQFLSTLPPKEFNTGCAEMIKHGCIRDVALFKLLSAYTPEQLQNNLSELESIIEKNVVLKSQVVQEDEFEKGIRTYLNFGHTLGHAIENTHQLMHGEAISIGMVVALRLSEKYLGLPSTETSKVMNVLSNYHLPINIPENIDDALRTMRMDKKRKGNEIRFVLLKAIGEATTRNIPIEELESMIKSIPVF